jgi:hypothetical protein
MRAALPRIKPSLDTLILHMQPRRTRVSRVSRRRAVSHMPRRSEWFARELAYTGVRRHTCRGCSVCLYNLPSTGNVSGARTVDDGLVHVDAQSTMRCNGVHDEAANRNGKSRIQRFQINIQGWAISSLHFSRDLSSFAQLHLCW